MKKIVVLVCIAISTLKAVETPLKIQQISNSIPSIAVKQSLQEPNNILVTKVSSRKKRNGVPEAKPHIRQKTAKTEV